MGSSGRARACPPPLRIAAWLAVTLLAACAPAPQPGDAGKSVGGAVDSPKKTSLVIGIAAPIGAFSYAYTGTSGGGARAFNELADRCPELSLLPQVMQAGAAATLLCRGRGDVRSP